MTDRKKRLLDIQTTTTRVSITDPEQLAAANDRWFRSMSMFLTLQERLDLKEMQANKVSLNQITTNS